MQCFIKSNQANRLTSVDGKALGSRPLLAAFICPPLPSSLFNCALFLCLALLTLFACMLYYVALCFLFKQECTNRKPSKKVVSVFSAAPLAAFFYFASAPSLHDIRQASKVYFFEKAKRKRISYETEERKYKAILWNIIWNCNKQNTNRPKVFYNKTKKLTSQ